jgi:hypothetical protein
MLRINDVIELEAPGEGLPAPRLAVLYLTARDGVITIDLSDERSVPVHHSATEIEDEITSGRAKLCGPVVAPASLRPELSEKQIEGRDRRWNIIGKAVLDEPRIYEAAGWAALVRDLVEQGHCRNSVVSWIQMYWRGGKTRNALVGNWHKCGAKGVERPGGPVKLGRPRKRGPLPGVNMNREYRRLAVAVIWREWKNNSKLKLTSAFEIFSDEFHEEVYTDGKKDPAWELKPEYRKTGSPTIRQFRYLFNQIDGIYLRRAKRTPRIYDLNDRALPGSVTAETMGPGSRYIIDATILNVYVRSRINRKRIVGRPVLYLVIDVWSRMIVGMYIGIENASWRCAAMAIANVVEDKVEFCRRYGIEIDPWEWPNAGLCGTLLGDNGEVASKIINSIIQHVNTKVETHGPYRADQKGLLEKMFDVVPAKIGEYLPGWVHPDFRQRGVEDYRLASALDIEDITKIAILAVVNRSNNVTLKKYDRDAGMPSAEVAPYPSDIWRWGIANRSGRFIQIPPQVLRFRLMEEATAKIDAHGLRFRGTWYLSDEMIARGWLDRARPKSFDVKISYDPRDANVVYLHLDGTEFGYEVCSINRARSRAYEDMCFWEVDKEEDDRLEVLAEAVPRELASSITNREWTRRIMESAVERTGKSSESRTEQIRGIVENRAAERRLQQAEDAKVFAPESPPATSAPAVPVHPGGGGHDDDDDYGVSILDIVGGAANG